MAAACRGLKFWCLGCLPELGQASTRDIEAKFLRDCVTFRSKHPSRNLDRRLSWNYVDTMKRNIFLLVLLTLIFFGVYIFFDHNKKRISGYCFSEDRYLNDQELKESALRALQIHLKNEFKMMSPSEQMRAIHYDNLEKLKELNPNCCDENLSSKFWRRDDMQPYWKDKGMSFFYSVKFRIHLDATPNNSEAGSDKISFAEMRIHSCGEVSLLKIRNSDIYKYTGIR